MKQGSIHDRLHSLLEAWVNLNSYTENKTGVQAQMKLIVNELVQLGGAVEEHQGALIARFEPNTTPSNKTLTLVSHADTVFPLDSPFQNLTWSADRSTATGPGVIDDKGSILVGLLALESWMKQQSRPHAVQFLCMPSEEVGSPGLQNFMNEVSKKSTHTIGLEPSLPDGSVIHSRRGNRWYELSVTGPGGHAGRDAGKVQNPVELLSELILKIKAQVVDPKQSSITCTSIQTSSHVFNVIPTQATARLDVRFDSNTERDQLHERMLPFLEKTKWTLAENCPAMPYQDEAKNFHLTALNLIEQVEGKKVQCVKGTGSSDSNHLSRPDLIQIDGMGAVGHGLHTPNETIQIASLITRSKVLFELLKLTV